MAIKLGNLTLFDVKELSKKFGLHPVTLRGYIKSGKLKGRKVGTRWYVSEENLREFFGEPNRGKALHVSNPSGPQKAKKSQR